MLNDVLLAARNIARHRRFISTAMVLSGLFLLAYVAYHFTSAETKFTGTGWVDVQNIRIAGAAGPLAVTWLDGSTWQAAVPLGAGANSDKASSHSAGQARGTAAVTKGQRC